MIVCFVTLNYANQTFSITICSSITESDVNNSFWFCSPLKPVFAVDTDVGYYQYPKCTEDNVCCWYRCGLPPVPKCTEDNAIDTDVVTTSTPGVLKTAVETDTRYYLYPKCTEDNVCCWNRCEILPVPQVYWRRCLLLKQMWDTTCTPSVLKTMFAVRCGLLPVPQLYWKECLLSDVGYYQYPKCTEKNVCCHRCGLLPVPWVCWKADTSQVGAATCWGRRHHGCPSCFSVDVVVSLFFCILAVFLPLCGWKVWSRW